MSQRAKPHTVRRLDTPEKVVSALGLPDPDEEWHPPAGGLTAEEFRELAGKRHVIFDWNAGIMSAFPIEDPERPDVLAEFAGVLALGRQGRQLVPSAQGPLRFFYFGTIARGPNGALELAGIALHPWPRDPGPGFRGVTREVLRMISPTEIVEAVAEWEVLRRISDRRWELRAVVDGPSDDPLRLYAMRYLALQETVGRGIHRRLAEEFGISPDGSREWTRRAKARGYLVTRDPGQGRAGALPGPNLDPAEEDDNG